MDGITTQRNGSHLIEKDRIQPAGRETRRRLPANQMYDKTEHTRLISAKERAIDLITILNAQAELATNPSVATALNEAADALDCWLEDEINNGALKLVERMEEDADSFAEQRSADRALYRAAE